MRAYRFLLTAVLLASRATATSLVDKIEEEYGCDLLAFTCSDLTYL